MPLPTAAFTPADTVYGVRSIIVFTPPGVSPTAINIIAKMVDYEGSSEFAKRLVPSADGITRPDRVVKKTSEEAFTFEIEELKQVKAVLGSMNGHVNGTAQIWITDPDDAAGKVKIKTDAFPCSVARDGNITFQDDFAKAKLKFTSTKTGDVTFTFDGDV